MKILINILVVFILITGNSSYAEDKKVNNGSTSSNLSFQDFSQNPDIVSMKRKLYRYTNYQTYGIEVFGKSRHSIVNKLKSIGFVAKPFKTPIYKNKINLYALDITDQEIHTLLKYLEIDVDLPIVRLGENRQDVLTLFEIFYIP